MAENKKSKLNLRSRVKCVPYYANICFVKSVCHRYGGRESYFILLTPNMLTLVLNC